MCCGKVTICLYKGHFGLRGVCVPPDHSADQTDLHPSPGLTKHAVGKGHMGRAASSLRWLLPAALQMWPSMGGKKPNILCVLRSDTHPLVDVWTLYRKMLPLNSREQEYMEEGEKGKE